MPTIQKPILDHRPMEPTETWRAIDAFLDAHLVNMIRLGRGDAIALEEDELGPMRRYISTRLFEFVAWCIARPVRATNKVIATIKRIAKDPEHFIANPEIYDAEAVDAVFVEFQRLSSDHKRIAHQFWVGQGTLDPSDVKRAALVAIEGYKEWRTERQTAKTTRGAPANSLLREFSDLAVELFQMLGGTATATNDGPFQKFVELLRMPVVKFAMAAGCALTPVSIIRLAAQNRARPIAKGP